MVARHFRPRRARSRRSSPIRVRRTTALVTVPRTRIQVGCLISTASGSRFAFSLSVFCVDSGLMLTLQNRKLREELDALESAAERKKKRRERLGGADVDQRFTSTDRDDAANSSSAPQDSEATGGRASSSGSSPWTSEQHPPSGATAGGSAVSAHRPRRQCANCGQLNSPEWRKGPDGQRNLCNRCGLRWSKARSNAKGAALITTASAADSTTTPIMPIYSGLGSSSESMSVESRKVTPSSVTPNAAPSSPYESTLAELSAMETSFYTCP
jgi:GATA zinc finger